MGKAIDARKRLVDRARSTEADWGMTCEDPLSIEVHGRYVDILFTTGGPHVEVQLMFDDAEAGEYWFENVPQGGLVIYKDWGESDYAPMGRGMAADLLAGVLRDPDELTDDTDEQGD